MTKPYRLGNIVCWAILVLILLAVLAVQIDERCSKHEDAWAREFEEMVSEKVSKGE